MDESGGNNETIVSARLAVKAFSGSESGVRSRGRGRATSPFPPGHVSPYWFIRGVDPTLPYQALVTRESVRLFRGFAPWKCLTGREMLNGTGPILLTFGW